MMRRKCLEDYEKRLIAHCRWLGYGDCYNRVERYCGESVIRTLERDSIVVAPTPNMEWIEGSVQATPGTAEWRVREVKSILEQIGRWQELAGNYMRTRAGSETVEEWLDRNILDTEEEEE